MDVTECDEFVTDDDPKGDEKINSLGTLLGGGFSFFTSMCNTVLIVPIFFKLSFQSIHIRAAHIPPHVAVHARHQCNTHVWLL